jgi:hypothetical protein
MKVSESEYFKEIRVIKSAVESENIFGIKTIPIKKLLM